MEKPGTIELTRFISHSGKEIKFIESLLCDRQFKAVFIFSSQQSWELVFCTHDSDSELRPSKVQ